MRRWGCGVHALVAWLPPGLPRVADIGIDLRVLLAAIGAATIGATLVVRTAGDPLAVLPSIKSVIWSINKDQPLTSDTVTLEGYMDRLIAQRRFGLVIGGATAWSLSARVVPFLFEIEPDDILVFAAALITLAFTGLLASAVPARRAATVDPLVALRHE